MATLIVTVTSCDKCGKPFDPEAGEGEAVRIGLGKSWYDLDLCTDDLGRMMGRVKPWVDLGVREPRAYATNGNGKRAPRTKAATGRKPADEEDTPTLEFSG